MAKEMGRLIKQGVDLRCTPALRVTALMFLVHPLHSVAEGCRHIAFMAGAD